MKRMRLEDIKIPKAFALTSPREEKMCECREFWRYEGKQDRPIVINRKGFLIDGYYMYLVLLEHCEKYAMVRKLKKPRYKNHPTIYIFGKHFKDSKGKVYMWRIPDSWEGWADNLQIGDMIFCFTKNGISPVIVQEVECLSKCPVQFPVKKVSSKRIIRNGEVVEYER